MDILGISLLAWNVLVCFIYGIDKFCARKGFRRISERTLLSAAFMFGGAGAMFGMVLFNHKTSKHKFRFLVPIAVIFNIVIIYFRGEIL